VLLTGVLWGYLRYALQGPATIHIGGAAAAPYDYPLEHGDVLQVSAEGTLRDVTRTYSGVPLQALIERAQPQANATLLLVQASDGYAFFIHMDEVRENAGLLLSSQGEGGDVSYNIVGAENSKAWVRGVSELTVIGAVTLEVTGALENPSPYDPADWQFEMDSISLDVGKGPNKYQGAPLGQVLQAMSPLESAETLLLHTDGEPVSLPLAEVVSDDDVRLFTIIGTDSISFAVARMSGEVIAPQVNRVEIK
jgi:DMSO/TMAO reductase YedYZ molybdopterin-dependent catalytic subunit